jgi:hypothetical protein
MSQGEPTQSGFPRRLTERESSLLTYLLEPDFPGVEELRAQAPSVVVTGLYKSLPTIVLLRVTDLDAPAAPVAHPTPVEARVRGSDPPHDVHLFVKHGRLESIELVAYDGVDPPELPPVEALLAPTFNGILA